MGFQGQLSSVNLTDIFQTLSMNRQTGTLAVTGPSHVVHIYFEQGNITMCSAPVLNGHPYLLDILAHKGHLSADKLSDLIRQQQASGHPLRDLILAGGMIADYELDEITAAAIEELVCPVFEWQEGDFTFIDGAPVAELAGPSTVAMGAASIQTTQLVMEATRRMDEWKRIREVITDGDALFIVDGDGRTNLKNVQTDPDMLKVLRYLDGRHHLDAVALAVGVTRFDTFAIVAQLVLAAVARPRTTPEVVEDAISLLNGGDAEQAAVLLELCLKTAAVPEVMRPLAEACVKLNQAPRAVELYLELIQHDQDQGDMPQALKDLDTVIELSPDDPDLHFERGQIQAEVGQVEAAASSYSTAAQAYLSRKDLTRAVDACHRAKNLLPRAPEPHRYLARAYLLEGQTENAVVEYKSLWHALLTAERPKAALETLRGILDTDCKYANVKDQVLSHAQNSEAIKTSKAARLLIYVLILILVGTGGVFGYQFYQQHVVKGLGMEEVNALDKEVPQREIGLDHPAIKKDIEELLQRYGTISDVRERLARMRDDVQTDFDTRAQVQLAKADTLQQSGKYEEAQAVIADLKQKFFGTKAAGQADALVEQIHSKSVGTTVADARLDAESLWASLQWDKALAKLDTILVRKDLPAQLREALSSQRADWATKTRSSEALFARAARIEDGGNRFDALAAYRKATQGQGPEFAEKARQKVLAIELDIAHDLGKAAQDAAARGLDEQAFASLDKLAALAKEGSTHDVADYLNALALPFTVEVADPHADLQIARASGAVAHAAAPAGQQGPWRSLIQYRVDETVRLTASCTGFTAKTFEVRAAQRKSGLKIALARGPRWCIDLSGMASARPLEAPGPLLLIGTDKSSIEMVDPATGTNRPWLLPSNAAALSGLSLPPTLFQGHAFTVLDQHIYSIELGSRVQSWRFPIGEQDERPFSGYLWVQDHEIQAGMLMVIAPLTKRGVLFMEVDSQGQVKEYPVLAPNLDVTGGPLVDHPTPGRSLLYLPTSTSLAVYDVSSVTSESPATFVYDLPAKADLIGRPVKARVLNRNAIVTCDRSGTILAIDADPNAPHLLKSWYAGGSDPSVPVFDAVRGFGFVLVGDGRVDAFDLNAGTTLWQYPQQGIGGLGQIPGQPALGAAGVYLADDKGILHCLDERTGQERWQAPCGGPVAGGIIALDGRVYIPLKNGQLVCFDEGDG
jgi:tetratricopeptide (TPR) repeat protein